MDPLIGELVNAYAAAALDIMKVVIPFAAAVDAVIWATVAVVVIRHRRHAGAELSAGRNARLS